MEKVKHYDMLIRMVEGYGFLPIIVDGDGQELYRGEYQDSAEMALVKINARIEEKNDGNI